MIDRLPTAPRNHLEQESGQVTFKNLDVTFEKGALETFSDQTRMNALRQVRRVRLCVVQVSERPEQQPRDLIRKLAIDVTVEAAHFLHLLSQSLRQQAEKL